MPLSLLLACALLGSVDRPRIEPLFAEDRADFIELNLYWVGDSLNEQLIFWGRDEFGEMHVADWRLLNRCVGLTNGEDWVIFRDDRDGTLRRVRGRLTIVVSRYDRERGDQNGLAPQHRMGLRKMGE